MLDFHLRANYRGFGADYAATSLLDFTTTRLADFLLVSGRRKIRVHVSGPASTRDINSASALVHRGHGIGLMPSTYCDEAVANGRLVRLLPKWTTSPIPVFALYPSRKFLPLRLSAFLDALSSWKGPLWIKDD